MTGATTRPGHVCKGVRDHENRLSCLSCGKVEDEGDTGRAIGYGALAHGRVHDIVCLVPETLAELDDDGFATARGLGR